MALPVVLDVFLWLGPRLSVANILRETLALLPEDEAIATWSDQLLALAPQTNVLTGLSFPVVGVPALMVGPAPEQTPLHSAVFELQSLGAWTLTFLVLSLIGLVLGALYFNLLAQAVRPEPLPPGRLLRRTAVVSVQLIALVIIFLLVLLVLSLAMIPVILLVSFLGMGVTAVALIAGVLGMWLLIYFSFSLHGMVLHEASVGPALLGSVKLIQRHMWPTLLLLAAVVLVGSGLNTLWRLVDNGSWLNLVSIAGHAFINTGLMLATLLYYRARTEGSTASRITIT